MNVRSRGPTAFLSAARLLLGALLLFRQGAVPSRDAKPETEDVMKIAMLRAHTILFAAIAVLVGAALSGSDWAANGGGPVAPGYGMSRMLQSEHPFRLTGIR